jgi:hypothetical protein
MRGRGNTSGQTAAVKLAELGPRLTLKLFKVRELFSYQVSFFSFAFFF